ncbi:unnamed protein product [Hermetia illucens]|uniref:RNA-directed DNA polymerase n=1 Tax=Hermetia illucens TaxID=343691 RepID=A0A7R8UVC0_HERIL|nr:unnamed protein product [Hermetia illucens]
MSAKFRVKVDSEILNLSEIEIIDRCDENITIELDGEFLDYESFVSKYFQRESTQLLGASGDTSFNLSDREEPIMALNFSDLKAFIPVFDGRAEDTFNFVYSCSQAIDLASESQKPILFKRSNVESLLLVNPLFVKNINAYLAEQALMVFINGLRPQLSQYVVARKPKSVEEAGRLAQEEEQRLEVFKPIKNRDFTNRNVLPKIHKVSSDRKCYNCGKVGHLQRECRSKKRYEKNRNLNVGNDSGNSENRSNSRHNNFRRNNREKSQNQSDNNDNSESQEFRVNLVEVEESPRVHFFHDNRKLEFLIDTGNLLNLIAARHVFEENVSKTESISFKEFDGILGIPFLLKTKSQINFEKGELICNGNTIRLYRKKMSNKNSGEEIFINGYNADNVTIIDTLAKVNENGEIPITVYNGSDESKKINVSDIKVFHVQTETFKMVKQPVKIREEHMNEEEKTSIREIINEYSDLFGEIDPNNLTQAAEHSIDLNGNFEEIPLIDYDNLATELIADDQQNKEGGTDEQKTNIKEIVNKEEQERIIKSAHTGLLGDHRGINSCEEIIRRSYTWKNLKRDIKTLRHYIKRCELCQKYKIIRRNLKSPMVVQKLKSEPFERIQVDIVGPIQIKDHEQKIMTIQDNCTKYVRFIPVASLRAREIVNKILNNWIVYFGIPKEILTDIGPEFANKLMTKLCKKLSIDQKYISIYYPQSNGSTERIHARLKEYIGTVIHEVEGDLELLSGFASLCFNQSNSTSVGISPQKLFFGVKSTLMDDKTVIRTPSRDELEKDEVDARLKQLKSVREKARSFNWENKQKSKERYDQKNKAKIQTIKVGDKVLVRVLSSTKHKQKDKLKNWDGPYTVINSSNYAAQVNKKNKPWINKSDLKLFISDGSYNSASEQA